MLTRPMLYGKGQACSQAQARMSAPSRKTKLGLRRHLVELEPTEKHVFKRVPTTDAVSRRATWLTKGHPKSLHGCVRILFSWSGALTAAIVAC